MEKTKNQISVRAEIFQKISRAAKAEGVTLGTIVERALKAAIEVDAKPKRRPRRMADR